MTESRRDRAKKRKMDTDHPPYLPQDLVIDSILTRLPLKTLKKWSCVCKLWYNSIHHDLHFASSHFLQSQKNPILLFHFLNFEYRGRKLFSNYFFWSEDDGGGSSVDLVHRRDARLTYMCGMKEFIGYCNGLVCLYNRNVGCWPPKGDIDIINPALFERFWISGPQLDGYLFCYGFGFDSVTNEYKVVLILFSTTEFFKCLVFTLGTNSWRETTTDVPSLHEIWMTQLYPYTSAAIFCGGTLFWKSSNEGHKVVLLSFDLHDEKFQVIPLPTEYCVSTTNMELTLAHRQLRLVHLLESKGSLCVALLEEIKGSDDHQNVSSSCSKVHLYFLKDKVKQIWIEETFDNLSLSGSPLVDITSIGLLSSSDRVLLYWFHERGVKFYDLHTKHLKVVTPTAPDGHHIFRERKPPTLDYLVNSRIENFLSLKTFLPERSFTVELNTLQKMLNNEQARPRGFLLRESGEPFIF